MCRILTGNQIVTVSNDVSGISMEMYVSTIFLDLPAKSSFSWDLLTSSYMFSEMGPMCSYETNPCPCFPAPYGNGTCCTCSPSRWFSLISLPDCGNGWVEGFEACEQGSPRVGCNTETCLCEAPYIYDYFSPSHCSTFHLVYSVLIV